MKNILSAAAITLLTATGAFAQAANSPAMSGPNPSSGDTMMKSATPKSDAAKMKSDSSADANADAAAPKKAHHRMARNEAQLNASEAQTTKQLNEEQAQMAKGTMQ
jgi:hypothetical protein